MSHYRYEPDVPFDKGYRMARTQSQVVEHGVTEKSVARAIEVVKDPFTLVRSLASDNDVASLQVFLKEPWVNMVKTAAWGSINPIHSLPYCVAHMLIDNSGNEDFARQWMETYGHTREQAAVYYLSLWAGDTHENLGLVQKRLGVGTVADVFQAGYGKDGFAPFFEAMSSTKSESGDIRQKAREGAFLLKTCHPAELPLISMTMVDGTQQMVPYSDHLWSSNHRRTHHMLDAVGMAYEADNQAVRQQMQASIDKMLKSNDYLHQHVHTFEALKKWGKEGYGQEIWTMTRKDWGFVEQLIGWDGDQCIEHLQQLVDAGADINATFRPGVGRDGDLWCAIDAAVENSNPRVVAFLLANGADPSIPPQRYDLKDSAAQLALDMEASPSSYGGQAENMQAVAALIRVHMAKTAALAAIDELGLAAPAGRRP